MLLTSLLRFFKFQSAEISIVCHYLSFTVQRHPDHGAGGGGVLFWAHHEVLFQHVLCYLAPALEPSCPVY